MLLILRRRLQTDEHGAALAAVIGLMAVLLLLGATMASATIGALKHTSSDRASVQARAAAEAGIDAASAGLRTTNDCADPSIPGIDPASPAGSYRSIAGQTPKFAAVIESFDSGSGWRAGCPGNNTTSVRVTSTGTASSPGVAGATAGDEVTMEALFDYEPVIVQVPQVGSAVYAHTVDGVLKKFQLSTESNSVATSVAIKHGDVECTNGAEIGGDLLLEDGSANLDMCDVLGSVHVSGNAIVHKSVIGAHVRARGTASVTQSTVGGTVTFGPTTPPPSIPDWTDVPYDPAFWTARGYTIVNWTGPCSIDKTTAQWNALANYTTPTVINFLTKCATSPVRTQSDINTIELDTDLVLFAHQFTFGKLYFSTDTAGETRDLTFIVPDGTANELPTCAPPSGMSGEIRLTNEADFSAAIAAMVYTPCKIYSDRNGFRGQLYGGEVEFGQQASLTFRAVGIDGYDLTGGATTPVQTGMQLGGRVALRETAAGS
ncbi:hypothetical protein ACFFGH_23045 [Lysobacter korlensis]|uniref:Flp pilus-assembly TadG-like N-terminal domain-containing protein n=1 Tax=Lysobacter korlensis TaxID=553636 RepID=A0ABV6RUS1_9GAMM